MLNDQSGPYADEPGPARCWRRGWRSRTSARSAPGVRVEVVAADHQNKPDVGADIARRWTDAEGVDAIVDVRPPRWRSPSTRSPATAQGPPGHRRRHRATHRRRMRAHDRALDLRHLRARPRHRQGGRRDRWDSWFFITADYAFGHDLEAQTAAVVKANGGKVLGTVRHPLDTPDFSSFLLQAQASGAKVIGLANAGGDTDQRDQAGARVRPGRGGQRLAALLLSSPTSTRSGSRPRRACSSTRRSTGT